jgi:hypothetical protein
MPNYNEGQSGGRSSVGGRLLDRCLIAAKPANFAGGAPLDAAPSQHASLEGQEHSRMIPLAHEEELMRRVMRRGSPTPRHAGVHNRNRSQGRWRAIP